MSESTEIKPEQNIEKEPEFLGFDSKGGEAVATFLFSGEGADHRISLTREELEDKIVNLKKEGLPFAEQEELLKHWPRTVGQNFIPD